MKKTVGFVILAAIVAACIFYPPARRTVVGIFKKAEKGVEAPEGKTGADIFEGVGEVEGRVYIVRNGDYYHRKDCADCKGKNLVPRKIEECKALGLKPCPVCRPDQ